MTYICGLCFIFNKYMKYPKLLTLCAITAAMTSCSTSGPEETTGMAEVTLALTTDGSHNFNVKSQAEETLPEIDDFTVEIFKKANGKRLYRDTYANSTEKKIRLNGGDYNLYAFYGDSLKAGFDAAYYQAKVPFSITPKDRSVTEKGTAKLANVKVAVNYGENLKEFYKEFVGSVSTDKKNVSDTLTFKQNETRAAFIPAGNLSFRLYAKIDGKWKVYKPEAIKCEPNDFITFNVNTSAFTGKLTIGIKIDNSTSLVEKEWTVSATDVATEAPEIKLGSSLSETGENTVYEGEEMENGLVSVISRAGVKSAVLKVNSEYLTAAGVPAEVDLVNVNAEVKKILDKAGIHCLAMDGNTVYSGIDFSELGRKLAYSAENPFQGTFTLTVTDKNGNQATSPEILFALKGTDASLSLKESDVYSHRITKFSATVLSGDINKFRVEYKESNGSVWKTAEGGVISGNTISYTNFGGLTANTEYQFRINHNGRLESYSAPISVRTEGAEQVENAGFENWYSKEVYKKTIWSFGTTGLGIDEWFPKSSETEANFWATRNDLTTSQRSGVSCYYTSYSGTLKISDAHTGSGAAEISTVGWGEGNTFVDGSGYVLKNKTAGMLYMGEYTLNGETPETYGRAFTSRPDKFRFYYKFHPVKTEEFKAYIVVENRDNDVVTELGRAELVSGEKVDAYKEATLSIDYSNTELKATHMYVVFISSTAENPEVQKLKGNKGAFDGYSASRFVGSVLKVDDIELIYE